MLNYVSVRRGNGKPKWLELHVLRCMNGSGYPAEFTHGNCEKWISGASASVSSFRAAAGDDESNIYQVVQ